MDSATCDQPDSPAQQRLDLWRKRVDKELAQATPVPSFETLRTPLREGFALEPLYVTAPHAGHVAAAATQLADEASKVGANEAVIDLRPHAGDDAAQQLATCLLRLVGVVRDESLERVFVQVPVGADILREIAKLRALRRICGRLCELVSGASSRPALSVHAFAVRAAPAADLATNLIGNSASVFAAITGGADLVTPLAHSDAPEHRRLADNVVRLALHEAHLAAVSDPAAGSYALETLTESLCAAAWARFQVAFSATAKTQEAGR